MALSLFLKYKTIQQRVPALPYNAYIAPINSVADTGWGYISVTRDLENVT